MKKSTCLLTAVAVLFSLLLVPTAAAEAPAFTYQLTTASDGQALSDLTALETGDTVDVTLTVSCSDAGESYQAYGLQFDLYATGLELQYGVCDSFEPLASPSDTPLIVLGGRRIAFVWADMVGKECKTVPNPLIMTCTFTVTEPVRAAVWLETALIYREGGSGAERPSEAETAVVTLDLRGGTLEGADIAGSYSIGQKITLPNAVRSGYSLKWYDGADYYEAGDLYEVTGNVTLTAVWTKNGEPDVPVGPGGPTTTTTENPDGSVTTTTVDPSTGTVTEVTTSEVTDPETGTVTERKKETVTEKDGTTVSTETVKVTDATGTTGTTTTTTDADGETTVKYDFVITKEAIAEAEKTGDAVTLPVEVPASDDAKNAPAVTVTVPPDAGPVAIEVPVAGVSLSTVVVLVKPDGTEEVIKTAILTEEGVQFIVEGSATVKIVDNKKSFIDVYATDWYNDAVTFVAAHEIMNGTDEHIFSPHMPLNRGMVAMVVYNMENRPGYMVNASFLDVVEGAWYTDAIFWAAENGIVKGYSSESYGPLDDVTREQLVAILYRYANMKGYDTTAAGDLYAFTDGAETSDYAKDAMTWGLGAGLLQGRGNGILDPRGNASRAEVAQIFMNFVYIINR